MHNNDHTWDGERIRRNGHGLVYQNMTSTVLCIPMAEQARNLSHVLSVCTSIRVLQIHGEFGVTTVDANQFHRIAQLQNLEAPSLVDS